MSLQDLQPVLDDPKFQELGFETKRIIMGAKDPDFAALSVGSQRKIMNIKGIGVLPEETPIKDAATSALKTVADYRPGSLTSGAKVALPAAGMAAGAAFGPVGMALGAAAGAEGANLLQEGMGEKAAPTDLQSALNQTGEDLATGAMTAIGDKVAQVGTEAFMSPGPTMRSAAGQLADKAAAMGIKLRPDQLSENPIVGFVGSLLRKFPGTSSVMAKASAAQAEALNRTSSSILEDLGTIAGPQESGAAIQEATSSAITKLQAAKNAAYDSLSGIAEKYTKPATLSNWDLAKAIEYKQLDAIPTSELPDPASVARLKAFLAPNALEAPAAPPTGSFGEMIPGVEVPAAQPSPTKMLPFAMMALRKNLNGLIGDAVDTPEKVVYARLKDALDQDITMYASKEGGLFESALRAANAQNSAYKTLQTDPFIKTVLKSNPEGVVNKLMVPGNLTGLQVLKSAVNPKDWAEHAEPAIVNRLFSTRALTPSDLTENFPAGKTSLVFQKNMEQYPQKQLETLLPPKTLGRLKDFGDVMDAIKKVPDVVAGNASGTATSFIGQGVGPLAAANFVIKHPVTGIPVVLSSPALAMLWLTDTGREIVTEGLNPIIKGVAVSAARASSVVTALNIMQKVSRQASAQPPSQSAAPSESPNDVSAAEMTQNPAPSVPMLAPNMQTTRSAVNAFMNHDEDGALQFARKAYGEDSKNLTARRIIERVLQKRGDTEGLRKELGYKK